MAGRRGSATAPARTPVCLDARPPDRRGGPAGARSPHAAVPRRDGGARGGRPRAAHRRPAVPGRACTSASSTSCRRSSPVSSRPSGSSPAPSSSSGAMPPPSSRSRSSARGSSWSAGRSPRTRSASPAPGSRVPPDGVRRRRRPDRSPGRDAPRAAQVRAAAHRLRGRPPVPRGGGGDPAARGPGAARRRRRVPRGPGHRRVEGDLPETRLVELVRRPPCRPCDLLVVPRLHDFCTQTALGDHIACVPIMRIRTPSLHGPSWVVKRLFDITLATVALVIMAPVMAVCALAVRRARRVGPERACSARNVSVATAPSSTA